MREPGGVLLISCYELGHQPLGLASPLALLERAGYAPSACDLAVEPLEEEAVRRARFVGISVPMHTALRIGMRAAERVRALNPAAHVCFYGLYAPLNRSLLLDQGGTFPPLPRDASRFARGGRQPSPLDEQSSSSLPPAARYPRGSGVRPLADSIIGGEYEQELLARVRSLDGGPATPSEIVLARIPFAPPSRRALPPLSRYARLVRPDGSERLAGYTEASRGCLHRCRHCPIPALYDGRFFVVPEEVVLADVRGLVAAGAEHLTLGDPDFLNGPGHALAVARAIHREFPSLTFDVTAKIEHLLRRADLLPELARLGCLFVVSAVESLSDRVLAILAKGHTRADVVAALDRVRAAGMTLRPSLIPFTPWSTLADYLELFAFVEEHDLLDAVDPVQLTIRLLLPPGSLLLEREEMKPWLGALDRSRLSYDWRHPDPRMDALHEEAAALLAREGGHAEREQPAGERTFFQLRALAFAAAGREPPRSAPRFPTQGAPRLTETWFC